MANDVLDEIKFGTDGWRAVISDQFTFKNVEIVAQAVSEWVNKNLRKISNVPRRIAVGYDTRFLSKEYAEAVSCVLAANNIEVHLSKDAIPTPALSFGVPNTDSLAGIMITASHNPAKFNGIKIKTGQGGGAGKDITDTIESYLGKSDVKKADFSEACKGKQIITYDFKVEYINFIRGYLDLKKIKGSRFKVIADVMYGSGNGLMAEVLKGTSVRLTLMRDDVNPSFDGGKPEPIEECVPEILERVKKEKFDLGLVLDGDADRIAAVASGGEYINPQRVLALLAIHLIRNRKREGGIVKTICGSMIMDRIAEDLDLKLFETPVGFKYISDLMVSEEIVVGGEEAGGMGVQGFVPERDGTLAGLLLLEMMAYQKKNIKKILQDVEKEFGRYYYQRSDQKLGKHPFDKDKVKKIKRLLGKPVVDVKTYDGVKLICADESWLMFRPSGTEPLVRIYSEAKSLTRARQLIKHGQTLLKK